MLVSPQNRRIIIRMSIHTQAIQPLRYMNWVGALAPWIARFSMMFVKRDVSRLHNGYIPWTSIHIGIEQLDVLVVMGISSWLNGYRQLVQVFLWITAIYLRTFVEMGILRLQNGCGIKVWLIEMAEILPSLALVAADTSMLHNGYRNSILLISTGVIIGHSDGLALRTNFT